MCQFSSVWPPHASITASHLHLTDQTKRLSDSCQVFCHSWIQLHTVCSGCSRCCSHCFNSSQTCKIGDSARCWGFCRTVHSARPWHREDRHWPAAAQSLVHGSAQMVQCGSSSWYCKPLTAPSKVTRSVWWSALTPPQPIIAPPPSQTHPWMQKLARCTPCTVILHSSVSTALSHWIWRSCTLQWALLYPTGHGDPALLSEHCSAHSEQAGERDQQQHVVCIGLAQANTCRRYQKGDGASRDGCWLNSVPQVLQWCNNPADGALFGGWMNSRTSCAEAMLMQKFWAGPALFTPLFTWQYFGQKLSVIQGVCQ